MSVERPSTAYLLQINDTLFDALSIGTTTKSLCSLSSSIFTSASLKTDLISRKTTVLDRAVILSPTNSKRENFQLSKYVSSTFFYFSHVFNKSFNTTVYCHSSFIPINFSSSRNIGYLLKIFQSLLFWIILRLPVNTCPRFLSINSSE